MCPRPHLINPSAADLSGKHRAKSVPTKPERLVTDVDAALVQQILDVTHRQREPGVHHYRKADDLTARLKCRNGLRFVIRQR